MSQKIRILYIDDNQLDRELVRDSLEKEHGGFKLTEAKSQHEFEKYIFDQDFDVVLTDFNILGYEGLDVLDSVKERKPGTPVIVVTGTGSETVAVEAMKRGAADYVIKTPDHIRRLPQTILTALEIKKAETERQQAQQALRENRQHLKNLIESVQAGIVVHGKDSKILDCNSKAEELLGKSRDQLLGIDSSDPYWNLIREDGSPLPNDEFPVMRVLSQKRAIYDTVLGIYRKNEKQPVWLLVSGVPQFDEGGQISRVINSFMEITKRKRAETALKESEEKFRSIFESAADGILYVDQNAHIIDVNQALTDITGIPRKDIVAKSGFELAKKFLKGTSLTKILGIVKNTLANKIPDPFELKYLNKILEISIKKSQKDDRIVGLVRDVTQRKQAEKALLEEEKKYRNLLENVGAGISYFDLKGNLILFNTLAAKNLGGKPEDFIGKSVYDLFGEKEGRKYYDRIKRAAKEDSIQEYEDEVDLPSGKKWFNSKYSRILNEKNKTVGVQIIANDITKMKCAEEKLIESESRYKNLVESSPDGILTISKTGTMISINKTFCQLTGYKENDFVGKHFLKAPTLLKQDLDFFANIIKHIFKGRIPDTIEFKWKHAKGEVRDGEAKASLIKQNSKTVGVQVIVRDITDSKKAQEELKRIEWLLEIEKKDETGKSDKYVPFYGDVTKLNTDRTILDNVGKETLELLASDIMNLLDTSVAVYEKNGDYAFGRFDSGWCQKMDAASRKLCNTDDNVVALKCGKWLCHDYCWNDSAKEAIKTGKATDIDCVGGIKLYAEPIRTSEEIIGVINIGYGNPPTDDETLNDLADKYNLDCQELLSNAKAYKTRPPFIIETAKKRLRTIARLIGEIVENTQKEKRLKERNEFIQTILDNLPIGLAVNFIDQGTANYINKKFEEIYGWPAEEIKDIPTFFKLVYPDPEYRKKTMQQILSDIASGDPERMEWEGYEATTSSGEKKIVYAKNIPLPSQNLMISTVQDITERKKAQEQMEKDLKEKTILLNEVHHRVKNSLQVVASLLQLQSNKVSDDYVVNLFQESRNRVFMMASVYEKLYRSDNLSRINFKKYMDDVIFMMYYSSGKRDRIDLKLDIGNYVFGLDDAIPLSLILNELFTNSMKHAFPDDRKGKIEIKLKQSADQTYVLVYRDDGVGLPKAVNFDSTKTLGLNLVKNLANQIEGEVVLEQNNWTTFKIRFRGYESTKTKHTHR